MKMKREPTRESAIEKKNRIIQRGFELICEKGYNNVNCVDIAKYAEVSTGIIYQYFNNKKDIFIQGIENYSTEILFPTVDILNKQMLKTENLDTLLGKIIDESIKVHKKFKKAHEEITAISWIDKDIAKIINNNEIKVTEKIANMLIQNDFNIDNIEEKVHVVNGIIDNYCHEVVCHKHETLDYEFMKKSIINLILSYFNEKSK